MPKSIEIRGGRVEIGDKLSEYGQRLRVRGFYKNLPVVSMLEDYELRGVMAAMRSITPFLKDSARLSTAVQGFMERNESDNPYDAYTKVVEKAVGRAIGQHVHLGRKAFMAKQLLEGIYTMQGKGVQDGSQLQDKDFISERHDVNGNLIIKKCPFAGVARMLCGATYSVFHENERPHV